MQQTLAMLPRLARLVLCAALCSAVSALGADLPSPPAGLSVPAKPFTMPAFDLPTTAGPALRSESLRGQVLIIRFWASW